MRPSGDGRRRPAFLATSSAVLALAGVAVLLLVPMGTRMSASVRQDGNGSTLGTSREERTLLLDEEGVGILGALAVPVLLAAAGAALGIARRSRAVLAVTAGLLWVCVVLALFSVGAFFARPRSR